MVNLAIQSTLSFLLVLLVIPQSWASARQTVTGELELAPNHKIHYRYAPPQGPSKGNILTFNGLIYNLNFWNVVIRELNQRGYGVVQFAYGAQPESLRLLKEAPFYLQNEWSLGLPQEVGFSRRDLALEGARVLEALKISEPVHLVALSYGSFIATSFAQAFPEKVDQVIYISPGIQPSQVYEPMMQNSGWNNYFQTGRQLPGVDYQYRLWLRSALYTRMLQKKGELGDGYVPEGLSFNDFFLSVFHMVRAARHSDLKEEAQTLPERKIHLLLAGREEPSLFADQMLFWQKIPDYGGKILLIKNGEHGLPGTHPVESAQAIEHLLQ